ncbi:DTW protein [Trypanosoma melophagium]|uniref:DTW protein n=1 Tax=Trypanosoma melophagium TaxID=715481 RepID=UPI00351A7DAD|nr:DTW protein [Trypanosoma melophagium]
MVSAVNPYKESMRRLVAYAGIPQYGTAEKVELPAPTTTEAVYFHAAETPEWKAHLTSLPFEERYLASVRRRLSTRFWASLQNKLCLWCWFPEDMCFCSKMEEYRKQISLEELNSEVDVTMLMHVEEVMRGTNSGHIAAFILGAPIRVWGVKEDDLYLETLVDIPTTAFTIDSGDINNNNNNNNNNNRNDSDSDDVYVDNSPCTISLYPEPGAVFLENFVCDLPRRRKVHLLLSDATWGQAAALNRHIPRGIPRVALSVDGTYTSLFKALRKRTRETGVSTLEATAMAVEQCLRGLDDRNDAIATRSMDVLTSVMKDFVNLRCLLKYQDVCFTNCVENVAELVERRDAGRRIASQGRLRELHKRVENDMEVRNLLVPPVLNYCYACDTPVLWHRMVEHVLGKKHQKSVKKNPFFIPSEGSRWCLCPRW